MSDSLIYKKLSNVQLALMRKDIKKTGFNKFKKYRYYTLDDLMAPCIEECNHEGLTFFFNFRNGEAIIRLHEWEKPERGITCGLPFPELINPDEDAKNKNNILVQDLGAAVTYLKRYLLINLFAITDVELIDSDDASSAQNNKSEGIDGVIERTVELLKAKGVNDDEINPRAIYNTVNSNKELPQSVKTNMLDWYKGFTKEEKTTRYVGASA